MIQSNPGFGSSLTENVDALKVLVCPVEQAPAQRDLLSFVFCTAVPIVGVVAGLVDEPTMIGEPEDQGRLIST